MGDGKPASAESFMTRSPKRRVGPLLGLSAVLVSLLMLEIQYGPFLVPEASPVLPAEKNSVAFSTEPPRDRPAISTFGQIVERPLFSESRRPMAKKAPKVAESASRSETFELVGVLISPAGRMALLRTVVGGEIVRALEGKEVNGWEVRTIRPTQVILAQGDESDVLKITDSAPRGGSAPSSANNAVAYGDTALSQKAAPNGTEPTSSDTPQSTTE